MVRGCELRPLQAASRKRHPFADLRSFVIFLACCYYQKRLHSFPKKKSFLKYIVVITCNEKKWVRTRWPIKVYNILYRTAQDTRYYSFPFPWLHPERMISCICKINLRKEDNRIGRRYIPICALLLHSKKGTLRWIRTP